MSQEERGREGLVLAVLDACLRNVGGEVRSPVFVHAASCQG